MQSTRSLLRRGANLEVKLKIKLKPFGISERTHSKLKELKGKYWNGVELRSMTAVLEQAVIEFQKLIEKQNE